MIYKEFEVLVNQIPYDNKKKREYHENIHRIDLALRDALEVEYGTKGNLKAHLLWEKSWDYGHSAGYYEVENFYKELSDLIK